MLIVSLKPIKKMTNEFEGRLIEAIGVILKYEIAFAELQYGEKFSEQEKKEIALASENPKSNLFYSVDEGKMCVLFRLREFHFPATKQEFMVLIDRINGKDSPQK